MGREGKERGKGNGKEWREEELGIRGEGRGKEGREAVGREGM